jgi:hypothetical protein
MERVKGIEPSSRAWEAYVLPLNHTRSPNGELLSKYRTARQQAIEDLSSHLRTEFVIARFPGIR